MSYRKIIVPLLCGALAIAPAKGLADIESDPSYNEIEQTSNAADNGISISMLGWGLALVIGIVILAVTVGSNDNSSAH